MKTTFYIIIIGISLINCKSYKLYNSQQITEKQAGNERFSIEKGKMIISSKVDGKTGKFIFDTGASGSLITDTTIVNNFSEKEKSTFGMMKDAQRNQIKKVDFLVEFENGLFSGSPKLFAYYQIPGNKEFDCLEKNVLETTQGILGLDFFTWNKEKPTLILDFTNSRLEIARNKEQSEILKNGFREIKSKFSILNEIYIYVLIHNKEYKVKFDTGSNSGIILPYSEIENFTDLKPYEIIGNTHFSLSGISSGKRTNYYSGVDVTLNKNIYTQSIQLTENLNVYNVGMKFIKSFDWMIDFQNKKMYNRKNETEILADHPEISVGALAQKGKLKIVLLGGNYRTKYELGQNINSINGQKVNLENLCEMQKLLNETEDWSTLEIEVEK